MDNPIEAPVFKPKSERSLPFRGKDIATADLADGKGYVSLRSLCDGGAGRWQLGDKSLEVVG